MSEQDCLFCKILAGTAAADVVYQDSRCVAIRDINPQAPTHVLIIPREHLDSLDDASQKDESMLGHLLRISARVANDHGLSESGGYRTVINTGSGAGQSVFHLHVHVHGRTRDDLAARLVSEPGAVATGSTRRLYKLIRSLPLPVLTQRKRAPHRDARFHFQSNLASYSP